MFRRLSIALLAVAVFVPLSIAQMRGTMRGAMVRPVSTRHTGLAHGVRDAMGRRHRRRPFTRENFPTSPFLYSDYYSDYDSSEPYIVDNSLDSSVESAAESALPQLVIVQPSADDSPRKNRPAPLLIEWQGDRYVRFGGADETGEHGNSAHPDYAEPATKPTRPPSAIEKQPAGSQAGELPPAVLVYRDGHREEIPDFAIADGVIYVGGNYWQNGYWTKHIPLSALDQPATMQANQQRGVKFMLPSAPNVVIASF